MVYKHPAPQPVNLLIFEKEYGDESLREQMFIFYVTSMVVSCLSLVVSKIEEHPYTYMHVVSPS
jgi:hypothetical protein